MRHHVAKVRFSRPTSHRIAMFRNMVTSLIEAERIETTLPKAKQLKSLADRMITLGKKGTLEARRRALQVVRKKSAVSKLFTDLADRFKERAGGYTRVLKLGYRHGDGAPMALVEYVDFVPKNAKKETEKSKKTSSPKKVEKKTPKAKAPKKKSTSKAA